MNQPGIHPTAAIDPDAVIGSEVEIGAFTVIEAGARIGDRCRISAHVVLRAGVELGCDVSVHSFAVVGGEPQMRAHEAPPQRVRIGDRTVLREGVTINQPTAAGGETSVGSDCYLMANCHVGHDSVVGASVTLANNEMLGGHVTIGDCDFLGGGAGVHQFVRIGEGAMVSGNASISYDVPPLAMAAERNEICGLNLVGIRRRGIEPAALADLKRCFHEVFRDGGNVQSRAADAQAASEYGSGPEGQRFLEFFAGGRRGFARHRVVNRRD